MSKPKPSPSIEVPPVKIEVVAGLDTSSSKFHLYCSNGYSSNLTIPERPTIHVDIRRRQLFDHARVTFSLLPKRTLIVCEEPIITKNGKTSRVLSLAAGAIWAGHTYSDVFWVWADIAAWKLSVIGKGNANKKEIQAWVKENMNLKFPETELDFYDAAALCRYGEKAVGLV